MIRHRLPISTEQIVQGIQRGQLIAPLMPEESIIDQHVADIRSRRLEMRTTDPATQRLMRMVEGQFPYIRPAYQSALQTEIEVLCLPLPLSLAYAQRIDDRGLIVVSQGLIDLIAYRIACAHLEARLPERMLNEHLAGYRSDLSTLAMLSNALMLLGCQFYARALPMPDVLAPLTHAPKEQWALASAGAITFVLLHELGHLQLGHLECEEIRPMRIRQAVPERLSTYQHQEHEADRFAADALIDEARVLAPFWQSTALTFFQDLELITGERSESHPLAINRRLSGEPMQRESTDDGSAESGSDHVQELARRFLDTEAAVKTAPNALITTSREGCQRIVRAVIDDAFEQDSVDLRAVYRSTWKSLV